MSQTLKTLFKQLLAFVNVFTTETADKNSVQNLLQNLYPIRCSPDLIRVGPNGNGGYLVPDDFEGIRACFSPGVSFVSGFEHECADRGMRVFLADRSVEKPALEHEHFSFFKKFIGAVSNDEFMTLDEWVADSLEDADSDLILQMDIEGFEYETILATSEQLMRRFRIVVIEFHMLDKLWSDPFFKVASRAFDKILMTHACVHIHPNNCKNTLVLNGIEIPKVMEFTFLRKDRVKNPDYQQNFPHPLDYDNTSNQTIVLPKSWYM